MQRVFRRPSGIYVFRLAVPVQLRQVFGKTEVIDSTGTRELAMATIVVSAMATQWRQRFCDARLLLSATTSFTMDYQEILRLANGSLDVTRFNRHLLRSKLNWSDSHEDSEIPSRIQG